jgi:hypothetical protein
MGAKVSKIEFVETHQPRGTDGSPLAATDYVFLLNRSECVVRVHSGAILTLEGQLAPEECELAARTLIEIRLGETGEAPSGVVLVLDSGAMDRVADRLGWLDRFYRVSVSDYSSSVAEWRRASAIPASALPALTEEQKRVARKLGVSEEAYQRGLLAGLYGNRRQREKARRLGERVTEVLKTLGSNYRLVEVVWEGTRLRWLVRVQTPEVILGVPVPFELADDVVDSGVLREVEKLRELILSGVGRQDSLSKSPPV